MIIADTSGLLAFFNRSEPEHELARRLVSSTADPLVVSPYVVAELDYLIRERVGVEAGLATLRELGSGAYLLASFDATDLATATGIVARYRDQAIGVADASIVVLADRFRSREVLTLDHRHFSVLRPITGGRFKLVP